MNGSLAAWLSSWSRQTPRKSRYISSTTGRMPGHGRADAEAHDRRLGDRGVAHPVAEPVAQPAGEPEDVAARRRRRCRPRTPARRSRARPRARRGSRPSCGRPARPSATGAGSARTGRGRTTKSVQRRGRRAREPAGRLDGLRRARRPPTPPASRSPSSSIPAARSTRGVHEQRVALLPLAQLVGRPVALRVALVVAVPAVGRRLDDDRAAARRARAPTTSSISGAVATTSLPSTAT